MDENIRLTFLYDIYGKLLTIKQQEIFEEYYLFNLSLREIAKNKNISYQAVRDSIKKSKDLLNNLESNIKMFELKEDIYSLKKLVNDNKSDLNKVKSKLINKINEISEVE